MDSNTNGEAMQNVRPLRDKRDQYEVWYEDEGVQILGRFEDVTNAMDTARVMGRSWGLNMRVRRIGD